MWGKPWNVLGVVSAVAERLEQFDASGAAGRSWLRLKMIRVPESVAPPPSPAPPLAVTAPGAAPAVTTATPAGFTEEQVYEVLGGGTRPGEEGQPTGELLSTIVARFHPGRPDLYKAVAALNGLDDARWVEPGRLLTIPPLPSIELPASPTMGPPTAAPPSFGSPTTGARRSRDSWQSEDRPPDRGRLGAESDALVGARVQQRLSLPTLCELSFRDPPGPLSAADRLEPGSRVRVTVPGHDVALFDGQVTAYQHLYEPSGGHEVRVRAYDALHRLRKTQTVRAHVGVQLPALAEEMVGPLGLVVQGSVDGPVWDRFIQHRQSDLEVLQELAERAGLYFHLREQVVHLFSLDGIGSPVELSLGQSLREVVVDVSGDPACRSVTATGWDPLRVETFTADAGPARSGRNASAAVPPEVIDVDGRLQLPDEVGQTDEQIAGLAQAELDRRVAREVTLWAVADGDPRLRPGSQVTIANVAERLAGRYVLSSVDHTVDDRMGFASQISTAPPPPRPQRRGAVATMAEVSRVDDPDALGRVRACLPTLGDAETEWMQVVSVGAGSGKGLVSTPDVGDQVLVLLANGDPAQGLVLGGLYGAGGAPDSGVEGAGVRRHTWLTAGGNRIRLDDTTQGIRLENAAGSFVELLPDEVVVHAAGDLTLEAPGRTVRIKGRAVDFEQV